MFLAEITFLRWLTRLHDDEWFRSLVREVDVDGEPASSDEYRPRGSSGSEIFCIVKYIPMVVRFAQVDAYLVHDNVWHCMSKGGGVGITFVVLR